MFIQELKKGDEVRVHSLDSVGILSEVDAETQKAVVRFGAIADDCTVRRCQRRLEI